MQIGSSSCMVVVPYSALKMDKYYNKELPHKCERGNKIAPSGARHECRRGAILLHLQHSSSCCIISTLLFSLLLNNKAIFDASAERRKAHVLKGCIKNCSIVKSYIINKVLLNNIKCMFVRSRSLRMVPSKAKYFLLKQFKKYGV